jgi:hypothetical protein
MVGAKGCLKLFFIAVLLMSALTGALTVIMPEGVSAAAPGAPQNLVATRYTGYVTLEWDAPTSDGGLQIKEYKIYRVDSTSYNPLLLAWGYLASTEESDLSTHGLHLTLPPPTFYNDTLPTYTGPTVLKNYFYKVSAVNADGEGVASTSVRADEPSDVTLPATITNLATSNPTSSSIKLSWTAPGDDGSTGTATTYDIRYRTGGAITDANWATATLVTGEPSPKSGGSSESFTVTGLSQSTTYYFAIKTLDEVPNISPISNSPSGTTTAAADATAPAAITNLATSNPTSSSIKLSWTAPGDDGSTGTATTYDIRYRTGGAITDANWATATLVTGEPSPKSGGSSESFTVSGLQASTTYYFAIKTADEVPNISPISNSPSGTTTAAADATAPAAIMDLATSNPTSSSIKLSWTAPGDDGSTDTATTYDIRYRTGGVITDANWATATQVTGEPSPKSVGSSESFTVTGLQASTTYYFAIKTADEVPNISPISNSPSGTTTVADTTAPAAITNLATSNPTSGNLQLSWTAPGDDGTTGTASTYDIRYQTEGAITDATWASATPVTGAPWPKAGGSSETFTVTGLTASTTYYFAIKTADEKPNWSPISNSPSGTTSEQTSTSSSTSTTLPPSAPQTLQAVARDTSIELTWQPSSDSGGSAITEYRIFKGMSSGTGMYLGSVNAPLTSYIDTAVTPNQACYYHVCAVNGAGEGPKSAEASAIIQSSVQTSLDSDGDGWSDEQEKSAMTNPYNVDTDGDGVWDPQDPDPLHEPPTSTPTIIPGFEAIFAIASFVALIILRKRC